MYICKHACIAHPPYFKTELFCGFFLTLVVPQKRSSDRTLTTREPSVAAARGSPPYGRCALKPEEVADPEYGAKAEPEEERPGSSLLGPSRTPELKDGQEGCRARDTGGWKRKP